MVLEASVICTPGIRLPRTQVLPTNSRVQMANTLKMARPIMRRSSLLTSSDSVEMASKPRNDSTQIEVAVNIFIRSKWVAS